MKNKQKKKAIDFKIKEMEGSISDANSNKVFIESISEEYISKKKCSSLNAQLFDYCI